MALRDHAERYFGFAQVMQQEFSSVELLPVCEGKDSAKRNHTLITDMLAANTNLIGIYNLGAGASGSAEALHASGRAKEVVFVAHELNAATRKGLLDGVVDVVIAQDPGHEIRSALRVLMARCDGVPIVAAMERISIDIFVRDNLP